MLEEGPIGSHLKDRHNDSNQAFKTYDHPMFPIIDIIDDGI